MPVRFETPRPNKRTREKNRSFGEKDTKERTKGLAFPKASEYDRSFKWVDSYLSKDFRPSVDQMFPPAGVASIDIANVHEPRLQSRRKPVDLTRTSTTFLDEVPPAQDDYILVGDQSKFAPSVKYRVLSKNKENEAPTVPKATKASENAHGHPRHTNSEQMSQPKHNLKSEKKAVDGKLSGKIRKGSTETAAKQSASAPALVNGTTQSNGVAETEVEPLPLSDLSTPPAPRGKDIAPVPRRKPDNYISRPTKPTLKTRPPPPPSKQPKSKPKAAVKKSKPTEPEVLERRPADPREKRTGKFNEFVQTDLPKGVADSGQEATADYAMKYRAGIPPPRPRGPKRLSEYQMQYQWKKGVSSSPLLAAEQIIYNSNPHLAPYSNPELPPKESEYNRAFKKYEYKPVPFETLGPAKKPKLQRSKSMEAIIPTPMSDHEDRSPPHSVAEGTETISPDKLRAAGTASGKRTEEDKRLLRESLNPTHLLFPHGKVRTVGTEYASNYRAPMKFAYDDGVWKGADPPQVQPTKSPAPVTVDPEEAPAPGVSWYKEVVELRKKAQEYKQRARGTHFSRQHLAQLYAQQADLWDTVSNTSTLSALSLESAAAMAASRPAPSDAASTISAASSSSRKKAPPPKRAPKQAWSNDQASPKSKATSVESLQGSPPGSAGEMSDDTLVAASAGSEQGRVPTPKFRKEHDKAGYKWRHHLDRTTPAVGGALLTSPPQRRKAKSRTKSEPALKTAASVPKVSASWAGPAGGLPTRDTHVLVDEEASTDRPLPTKYTQSPPVDKQAKKFPLGVDVMPTLRETLREMSNSSTAVDDDMLSVSARSVASSCSLASEVLERARNRRDEFWGNTKKVSRS